MPTITKTRRTTTTPAASKPSKPTKSPKAEKAGGSGKIAKPKDVFQAPPSVRLPHELGVVWHSVEIVENKIATRNPGWDALKESGDFQGRHAGDLANFLRYGRSSATCYEARQLGQGLGWRDVGGYGYGNNPKTWKQYTRGDRVEVSIGGETRRGLLVDVRPPDLRVLTADDKGQFHLDTVADAKILSAGVDDGRN
jgi:hypothetical protein